MVSNNNKISALQFSMVGTFSGMSLFEGISSVFLFNASKQNAWITAIIATILSLVIFYVFIKVINYEPNKNIIEKINHLFGNKLGQFINFILFSIVAIILLISSWSILNFIEIKYLTETPPWFITGFLLLTTTYVVHKGIETIVTTAQVLAYFSIIVIIIVTVFLFEFFEFENLKPILESGISPVIIDSLNLMCYSLTPFFLLTIIPKNSIVDKRHLTKYFLIGFIISSLFVAIVSFFVMATIGPELAKIYRFPTYYTLMKIGVPGIFENLENFLACLWISSTIVLMIMSIHYIKEYLKIIFNLKPPLKQNIALFSISVVSFFLISNPISRATEITGIIKNYFPYISITLLTILVTIIIVSKIKKANKEDPNKLKV